MLLKAVRLDEITNVERSGNRRSVGEAEGKWYLGRYHFQDRVVFWKSRREVSP